MNIQRFTATGFNPNNRCAEVAADDHGAWVLHDDVADMQRDAERYRWLALQFRMDPDMGGNHRWWGCQPRPELRGRTLDEAIDAAMQGANA